MKMLLITGLLLTVVSLTSQAQGTDTTRGRTRSNTSNRRSQLPASNSRSNRSTDSMRRDSLPTDSMNNSDRSGQPIPPRTTTRPRSTTDPRR